MNATHFQLVFEGEVRPGHDPGAVRNTLIELFELDKEHQTRLIAGEPIVLGRGMDNVTANTFKQVLEASGAVSQVIEDNQPVTADSGQSLRSVERRIEVKRRAQVRRGAILPDRRADKDRRE